MKRVEPPKKPKNLPAEPERKKKLEESATPSLLEKKLKRPITDMQDLADEDDDEGEDEDEGDK